MLETLLITFREGLEAFLIVAITLAYLTKTGRNHLKKPVYAGIVVALLISATTGFHIADMADTPFMEGILALVAGVLVASLTYYMMTSAHKIKAQIGEAVEKHAAKAGWGAMIGIFAFTVIMIAREGMETALMLGAISGKTNGTQMAIGAAIGIGLTSLIGYLWATQSHKINLKLFMQVTGVFLFLFSVHLFLYGIYELTEVEGIWMYNPELHSAMKPWVSSKTWFGQLTIYGLLVVPCIWLMISYAKDKFFAKGKHVSAAE
jgi:high-affinity iron transporter